MTRFFLILLITLLFLVVPCPGMGTNTVDPIIGTGGHGHTYPGAALPFGMVQLGPDTRLTGWDGCSAYHYSDSVIYGFSHTHLSGTGASDYGDILMMPTIGPVQLESGNAQNPTAGYCATFKHNNEIAEPGYYRVLLQENNINAELTVTPRVGIHQYTFPRGQQANIIFDLTHRDTVIDSALTVVGNREVEGFRRSRAWAKDQHVYFVARFSTPFDQYGLADEKGLLQEKNTRTAINGKNIKGFVTFHAGTARTILVKVGISGVSIAGARKNLEAEAGNMNFQQLRLIARKQWELALSKIKISGGSKKQSRVFYTALYHAMLAPNLYMDVDRQYRGRDLLVHRAEDFNNYTVFSLWDTFRAAHPLFTLIEPQRTVDFIKTFIAQYEQGGLLPVWELSANETFCMIGYHAVPVIVDAYIKGIIDFPVEKAYQAMLTSAKQDIFGLKDYRQCGFIPAEREGESVSKTLEYAYDDWCIAQMARVLGKTEEYREYLYRAQYYKNLFDPTVGFLRARMRGFWFTPFDPAEVNFNYTEANAWQYRFSVPQDIDGMIALLGGPENFVRQLDALFNADSRITGTEQVDITGQIGQYAHGNEPSHHIAYLYAHAGQPWKTQHRVRSIMDTMYSDLPDGLCGNEDCGQMSAWYILSALGFYPVTPGSDMYTIGTPLFPKAVIDSGNGRTFTIKAQHVSAKNIYIQSATLNNRPYNFAWLRHGDIVKGGNLTFIMGPKPNHHWASQEQERPLATITEHLILPVPYISSGSRTFTTSTTLTLACLEQGAAIYYTLDGSTPDQFSALYREPIIIDRSTTLKAIAIKAGLPDSFVLTASLDKIPEGRSIVLHTTYSPQYSAGGDLALIDGNRGLSNFRTGTWQGYQGSDLEAVIDLGTKNTISKLTIGFLQDINAWVFMPLQVEYHVSSDGQNFVLVATVANDISAQQEGVISKDFSAVISPQSARYVKVKAQSIGICPSWHKGAGDKAWIFADEILVE